MVNPGDKISHYEILSLIGRGGMGEVWLAHDTILDRRVAVKFLPESLQADPAPRERFQREAKAAAALDHPFICQIYETGEDRGRGFIVMEYVEGRSLGDVMAAGPVPIRYALKIVSEIAEALEVAHAHGIVHRDLKPANILCTPQGHSKVMDFGIAKRIAGGPEAPAATLTQGPMTARGMIIGTIEYMSPEQAKGLDVDGRSDIFSLGIILYELLSGKNPFARPTPVETLSALIKDVPPPAVIQPKTVGPELQHILKKSLAKNPADRYAQAGEFAADIQKVRDDVSGRGGIFSRRWQVAAALSAAAVLTVALVGRFVLAPGRTKPRPVPAPKTVLVADFENTTGDAVFNGAVEQALILGMEDAPFINIYKREDARRKAGQLDANAGGRLDVELGRLVCRSEGIPVLITGSIGMEKPGTYLLKTRVLDPVSAQVILEKEKTVGKKADVPSAAAGLALPICQALGGREYSGARDLAEETFTTSSLEAMSAYSRAQELMKTGRDEEAIGEFKKALAADPGFGRAYSGLTAVYFNAGERQKAEESHKMALARIDSMTEREKFRTRGLWYLVSGNYPKAIEEYGGLIARFPADQAGRLNLAIATFYIREMAKAVEMEKEFIKLYPGNINGYYNLSWYALAAGDFALAVDQAEKSIGINPRYQKAYISGALAELAQGRNAECAAWYRKLAAIDSWGASLAAAGLSDLDLFLGRPRDAAEKLEAGIAADARDKRPDREADKWIMLGEARIALGLKTQAADAAERALALIGDVQVALPATEILLAAGKEDRVAAIGRRLADELGPESRLCARIVEGRLAEFRGKRSEAVAAYAESIKILDSWVAHCCLGRAYLEAGAFAEAHSEFESCVKRRGEAASLFLNDMPSFHVMPPIFYYLGRAQEGLKSPAAAEAYREYLKIRAGAQNDPLAADARKRLEALSR